MEFRLLGGIIHSLRSFDYFRRPRATRFDAKAANASSVLGQKEIAHLNPFTVYQGAPEIWLDSPEISPKIKSIPPEVRFLKE
jgi:hypothetical protein